MQKTTLAVWKALVAEAVRTEFPEFSVYPKKQRGDEAGLLKFASSRDGILWAIVFRPLEEAFDVFVGWSRDGRYPYENVTQGLPRSGESEMMPLISLSNRTGLASYVLWEPAGHQSMTLDELMEATGREYLERAARTLTAEESRIAAEPKIRMAIAEIKQWGIPYLERATSTR